MTSNARIALRRAAVGAAVCAALLAGCGKNDPASLVASAKTYLEKNDYAAAVIQLKNALQKDAKNGEARFLLGTALLATGDFQSAEKELRRAIEFGYPKAAAIPKLLDVMAALGQTKEMIAEFGTVTISDPAAQALIKVRIGEAYLAQGQPKEARAAFEAALRAQPGFVEARIGAGRVSAVEGDFAEATKVADDVLAKTPDLPVALAFKADLLLAQGKQEDAVKMLRMLLQQDPRDTRARVNLVSTLIALKQLDEAGTELATLRKRLPQDPRGRYMEALLAYRKGDLPKARDEVQQVLRMAPDNLPTLVLAGSVEYGLGAYATAETHLRKVVSVVPKAVQPRVLLAATYLRTGQPGKAEDMLEPVMRSYLNDPPLLPLAGEIALANGQPGDALSLYNRAAAASDGKNDTEVRTRAAQMRLATGDTERALRDLERISTVDEGQYQADLALVAAHLGKRDYEKALQAVANLEKKQPQNPLTYNTRGIVLVSKQDLTGARAAFEKALSLQPDYLPAARNLASLDLAAKQPDAARGRFETILAKEPGNQGALLALAETQARAGAPPKDIAATLERAVNAGPQSAAARLALINLHLANRDAKAATTVAQAAAVAMPDNPRILDALGTAQLSAGETNQSIATFNKLVDVTSGARASLLRLANAQFIAKDYNAAVQTLRRVIEGSPDFIDAYRQMSMVQIAAGRPDEALKEARALQKAQPKSGAGLFLEGEILSYQKRHQEAAAAYGQSVKVQPLPLVATRQYDALVAAGQTKEADALAARWMKEHPKDPQFRIFLADREIRERDYREAAKLYREVVAIQPENVIALNNLAWALHETGDASAVTYAERAYKLASNNPGVADTYGWILVQGGDAKRGVELLTQALAAAPNAPEIKLRLAKGLLKTGDRAGAKAQLESIVKIDQPSNAKTEAQQLLKTL